jgi:PST family polysaccharide transporter
MKELFIYQLIGDNFKIASWILMTVMISKAMFRKYLATHLFYIFLYICVSIILINHIGLIGSTLAYAASYILLTIFLIFLMKDFLLKGNIENDSISSC